MSISIRIPTPLRVHAGDNKIVAVEGTTVIDSLKALIALHPALNGSLFDEDGNVKKYLRMYLNDEDIRFLGEYETEVIDGDEILIVPPIAGGLRFLDPMKTNLLRIRKRRHISQKEIAMYHVAISYGIRPKLYSRRKFGDLLILNRYHCYH